MTPHDYDFLRKCLKDRSGLVLSADKQYLVESRLLPVARKVGVTTLGELVGKLRGAHDPALMTSVVEAMTTNETFFFRDKVPFEHFRATIMPALLAGAARGAHHSHLVRGGLHRPGALFAGDVSQRDRARHPGLAHRNAGDRSVRRSAGEGAGGHL